MSFNISWVYKAIDQFTPTAKKVKNSVDRLGTSLTKTGRLTDKVRGKFSRLKTRVGGTGDAIEGLQSKMAAFAAVAATAFVISLPLGQAIKFEEAMADVAKVVDFARPQGLKMMSLDVLDLSKRIPIAATGLAEIAAAGGQFGVAENKLIAFTEIVAKMSTAFDLMPGRTGEAVAKLSNIFEIPIDQFEGFADRINFVSNNVAASADEIIRSLQNKGAAAGRMMGLAAEDTLGLAATFIQLGVNADRVGSIMDSMSRRLTNVSVMGEAFTAAFTEKPRETLLRLLQSINKMPAGAKKAAFMTKVFGEMSGRVGLLADTVNNKLIPTLALANDAIGSAGSVTKEFEKRSSTAGAKIKLMKNRISAMAVTLGDTLLPALKPLVDLLGLFASGIGWVIRVSGPLAPMLFAGAAALLTISAATKAWAIAQAALNIALTMNPIGLLIVGLAAAAAAVIFVSDKFGGFMNMIKEVGNMITRLLLLPVLLIAKAFDALFNTNISDMVKDLSSQLTFDMKNNLNEGPADSKAKITVDINAPPGIVGSVESFSSGPAELDVGQNLGPMAPAGAG